jgi:hypothetical protein
VIIKAQLLPRYYDSSKHIDSRHHFARGKLESIVSCGTNQMAVYSLTDKYSLYKNQEYGKDFNIYNFINGNVLCIKKIRRLSISTLQQSN